MTDVSERSRFRHEALLYAGKDDFVFRAGAYIREGLEAGEAVLVVVGVAKIAWLREHLGDQAEAVAFADMADVGRNPARIIPAWRDFVEANASGAGARGIGEPIHPERSPDSLVECQRHESLLNVAFHDAPWWSLLCPYDVEALAPAVVEEALRSHPYVRNGRSKANPRYRGLEASAAPFDHPLPDPPSGATSLTFSRHDLRALRERVSRLPREQGFGPEETEDFVLAVHELATNSVRHGGGAGTVRLWGDATGIFADVRDGGSIEDPLAGRIRPTFDAASGRGLWIANQLCDLVQIRTYPDCGAVRVHLSRR